MIKLPSDIAACCGSEELYPDVIPVLQDGSRMHCHRCILAAGSDHFQALFSGHATSNSAEKGPLLVDFTKYGAALCRILLQSLYAGALIDAYFSTGTTSRVRVCALLLSIPSGETRL